MISYTDLKTEYGEFALIPYTILLTTIEWSNRRDSIIKRDQYSCTICGKMPTMPHTDELTGITYHLWFGEERFDYVKGDDGICKEGLVQEVASSPKPYSLQVHHKFYILENLPWEYNDEDLVTLCNWCHTAFHENNAVSVYKNNKQVDMLTLDPCTRCLGIGWISEYSHIQNGICFRCRGYGFQYNNM